MKDSVARLLAVRDGAPLIEVGANFSPPVDLDDAYRTADQLFAVLQNRHGPIRGYKVGATSCAGQRQLGLSEPFYGRLASGMILRSESQCNFGASATIEAEIGFQLETDLPARQALYSRKELESAIGAVLPIFEINRPAYAKPFEVGGLCLIADNGVTQSLVLGSPVKYSGVASSLKDEDVIVSINGIEKERGRGDAILGNPVLSLLWLANALSARNAGLCRGDVIASGALSRHLPMRPGDRVEAEYSTLGRIRVHVSSA